MVSTIPRQCAICWRSTKTKDCLNMLIRARARYGKNYAAAFGTTMSVSLTAEVMRCSRHKPKKVCSRLRQKDVYPLPVHVPLPVCFRLLLQVIEGVIFHITRKTYRPKERDLPRTELTDVLMFFTTLAVLRSPALRGLFLMLS